MKPLDGNENLFCSTSLHSRSFPDLFSNVIIFDSISSKWDPGSFYLPRLAMLRRILGTEMCILS